MKFDSNKKVTLIAIVWTFSTFIFLSGNAQVRKWNESNNLTQKLPQTNDFRQQQRDLPNFVLHVGPVKSGTTSIQEDIHTKRIKRLLRQDNYEVIDHEIIHNTKLLERRESLGNSSSTSPLEFSKDFIQVIDSTRDTGMNIFGSSEYLRKPTRGECKAWKNEILYANKRGSSRQDYSKKWNLQVVITYRRLHQFLPSTWNQQYKYFRINWRPIHLDHRHWPGIDGDIRIPSFEEWFVETYFGQSYPHPAHETFDAWRGCSDEIKILNIHDLVLANGTQKVESDLTSNFICKAFSDANLTCSKLFEKASRKNNDDTQSIRTHERSKKANRRRASRENTSVNLNYDILAVYAYEEGFIGSETEQKFDRKKLKRRHVTRKTQEFAELNDLNLIMKCPNTTVLDFIYNWSLESEEWALSKIHQQESLKRGSVENYTSSNMPFSLSKDQKSNFDADWERLISEEKFCSVDATETLKQAKWRKFFLDFNNSQ